MFAMAHVYFNLIPYILHNDSFSYMSAFFFYLKKAWNWAREPSILATSQS